MTMTSFANPSFAIKLGSNLPPIERVALYTDGTPVDLTAATLEFRFQLVDNDGQLDSSAAAQSGPATVVDGAAGSWSYDWSVAPASAGVYAGELGISVGSGAGSITVPFGSYIYFEAVAAVST
jgi:hypothetical protein